MNPLLKMLGGGGGNVFGQVMMQAIGALRRLRTRAHRQGFETYS